MSITVTGRKTTVTPSLKAYVDEKIGRSLEVFEATMGAPPVPVPPPMPAVMNTMSVSSSSLNTGARMACSR